jgi:hypothetical protein
LIFPWMKLDVWSLASINKNVFWIELADNLYFKCAIT